MEHRMTYSLQKLAVYACAALFISNGNLAAETPKVAVTPVVNQVVVAPVKDPVFGNWRSGKGKVIVEVVPCQENKICANIIGLAKPNSKNGKPKVDRENPDASLRSRPLIGLQVVTGMAPSGKNKWKGKIYNADDGRTYTAEAKLSGNKLVIKACWGPFCKDTRFTRVK